MHFSCANKIVTISAITTRAIFFGVIVVHQERMITEFRDIAWVQVTTDKGHGVTLLFDEGQHLDERIIREQFLA